MTEVPRSRFVQDMSVRWSCRNSDVVVWVTSSGGLVYRPEIVDYWRVGDGEEVLLTNRWEDLPDGFALHPTEVRGRYVSRMMAEIARGEHSSEIMDGPNIWRVKAGDRVAWVGPSRPDVPSADGVLAICEAAADVLVVGPMRMIQDLFDGSSASAAELTAEELQRCRAGYQAAVSLGLPRVVSAGQWALG